MDVEMEKMRKKMETKQNFSFRVLENGMLIMGKRIFLLDDKTLKDEVLSGAHDSRLAV
jgi:hypothetical protein